MGFERVVYKLKWPEPSRWAGLEVRLRGMDVGELKIISRLRNADDAEGLDRADPVLDILGGAMLSWNRTDDGEPVPLAEFRHEELAMLMAIVNAWMEAASDVPAPLPTPSSGGGKSEEGLIPMEIPSASHPSLSTPN